MTESRRMESCDAPPEAHCNLADASAEKAVKKVFAILGVDVDSPKQVSNFQDSLRFSDRLKKYADYGALVMIGALVLALAGAVGAGIVMKVKGGP